jgi:sugar phosphate isomerase/epimerase
MIRILINSIALDPNRWTAEKIPHYQFVDLLQPVVDAGFHFLEVWQYHISTEDEESVREIRQLGDGLGLSFPVIGVYPKLHLQGGERDRELEQFMRIVGYATILGADKIKLFVGTKGTADLDEEGYRRSVELQGSCTRKHY